MSGLTRVFVRRPWLYVAFHRGVGLSCYRPKLYRYEGGFWVAVVVLFGLEIALLRVPRQAAQDAS